MAVDSQVDSVSSHFPRQLDIAQVAVYGLSILSAVELIKS